MQKDIVGREMYQLAGQLFPICRSITGDGVRKTLSLLGERLPGLQVVEVPTGTQVFDWTVPREWNIRDAYIEDSSENKIISFQKNNLHVVGYSAPMDEILDRESLLKIIYTQPDAPDVIPYVTSYYEERSGFCMSERQKNSLPQGRYHAVIDSSFKDGSLTYGELFLPGDSREEVLLSTYICHPSMANNEISGPCVATYLAKWIMEQPRRYSYRILFVPETIGSITYLSRNLNHLKAFTIAGFNISCVGDDRTFSYIPSRYGKTLADKTAQNVLSFYYPDYQRYSFLDRGSDERQYCAPGVDIPLCCICRSKYAEYPEYHTSADNMDLISPSGLSGAWEVYRQCLEALEYNNYYRTSCICEPQLGRRGLYPTISYKGSAGSYTLINDLLAYADGENDLIDISNIIGAPVHALVPLVQTLLDGGLLFKQ